jgi:hypothetical protein
LVTSGENLVEVNSFHLDDTDTALNNCPEQVDTEKWTTGGDMALDLSFLPTLRVAVLGETHGGLHCERMQRSYQIGSRRRSPRRQPHATVPFYSWLKRHRK